MEGERVMGKDGCVAGEGRGPRMGLSCSWGGGEDATGKGRLGQCGSGDSHYPVIHTAVHPYFHIIRSHFYSQCFLLAQVNRA